MQSRVRVDVMDCDRTRLVQTFLRRLRCVFDLMQIDDAAAGSVWPEVWWTHVLSMPVTLRHAIFVTHWVLSRLC